MERVSLVQAGEIMGYNFIGPEQLSRVSAQMGIIDPVSDSIEIPAIPYSIEQLEDCSSDHLLVLIVPWNKNRELVNIALLRNHFGLDPKLKEPCFYNQDWYLNEHFANNVFLQLEWKLVSKSINTNSRGIVPGNLSVSFPAAVTTCYIFFVYYFYSGEILWKHDYIWCSDFDVNGDRIYTGRYLDPAGVNKNGFSIHRFLTITKQYGIVDFI